ncbi:Putative RTA-like protein [Septoria linicola]|uniref:RTA-like protein n=1 Tax=Septoria linicola TaxID=215465 RepID=A0A9Q9B233_9PEZI|nr:Putative RTA-like protein [Septoria linicola]
MSDLNAHGVLAAVELAFYAPAFLISVAICIKQGFSRNAGWFYMVLISVFRLIGASCVLYMETQHDYSAGLQETAAITSAVGTAPLLLALLEFLQRVNGSMTSKGPTAKIFRPIHLVSLVALILAIVGGVQSSQGNSGDYSTGRSLMKAGSVLFLLVWLALAAIAVLTCTRRCYTPDSESKLVLTSVCVLPFLLVRVIYTVAVSFSTPGSIFAYPIPNVVVQAIMMFAMEALALCFYMWAVMSTSKQERSANIDGSKD